MTTFRTASTPVLAVLLVLTALAAAGCVEAYEPARVPPNELPGGWVAEEAMVEGGDGDLRVTVHPYRSQERLGEEGPPTAALGVASINDLPVVDEERLLKETRQDQVERLLDLIRADDRVKSVELSDWREGNHTVRDGETATTRTARLTAVVQPEGSPASREVAGNVTLWFWRDAEQPMWVVAGGYALEGGSSGSWSTVTGLLADHVACHDHP